jgi:hypothetical protein
MRAKVRDLITQMPRHSRIGTEKSSDAQSERLLCKRAQVRKAPKQSPAAVPPWRKEAA